MSRICSRSSHTMHAGESPSRYKKDFTRHNLLCSTYRRICPFKVILKIICGLYPDVHRLLYSPSSTMPIFDRKVAKVTLQGHTESKSGIGPIQDVFTKEDGREATISAYAEAQEGVLKAKESAPVLIRQ